MGSPRSSSCNPATRTSSTSLTVAASGRLLAALQRIWWSAVSSRTATGWTARPAGAAQLDRGGLEIPPFLGDDDKAWATTKPSGWRPLTPVASPDDTAESRYATVAVCA